jgi:hypothetical protein
LEIAMYQARQGTCWGALPRRQRRLPRSGAVAQRIAGLFLVPTLICAAAVVAVVSYAPFH